MARPKVVVALLRDDQEFQVMQAADAEKAAARLGLELEVLYAEGNPVVQIHQLFRFIHTRGERPVALVVESTTAEGLERVARNAAKAGVGWLLVNTQMGYVEELRLLHPELPICSLGGDQEEVGRIQGRQVRRLLPGGGSVLCVEGPADSGVTTRRAAGLREVLGPADYQVKAVNGDWTEKGGARAMASWLRLKSVELSRPDIVVGQNDAMALGARSVVEEQRREWSRVPFLGCDGLPEGGRQLVAGGRLTATVVIPSNTGPALDLVATWLQKREPLPADVLLKPSSWPAESQLGERPRVAEDAQTASPSP